VRQKAEVVYLEAKDLRFVIRVQQWRNHRLVVCLRPESLLQRTGWISPGAESLY